VEELVEVTSNGQVLKALFHLGIYIADDRYTF